jgi:hypothetical protein
MIRNFFSNSLKNLFLDQEMLIPPSRRGPFPRATPISKGNRLHSETPLLAGGACRQTGQQFFDKSLPGLSRFSGRYFRTIGYDRVL